MFHLLALITSAGWPNVAHQAILFQNVDHLRIKTNLASTMGGLNSEVLLYSSLSCQKEPLIMWPKFPGCGKEGGHIRREVIGTVDL